MQRYFLISIWSLLFYNLSAQPISIIGQIVDENNNYIELAVIHLHNEKDSTHVQTIYSESNGSFIFSNLDKNNYFLTIDYLGYEKYISNTIRVDLSSTQITLIPIKLLPLSQTLQNVTVSAQIPYIERKADRTVVNVDALLSNAGSSAFDALEKAPGISTDQNGNIKLKGRSGVQVYIDDKPTYLSGQELENYLKSLPTGSVKQIEIMTNPPAKYEAAGNAGVINIVTKRNKISGFNGNLSLGFTRGKYTRSNNAVNFNYNTNKFSVYTSHNLGIRNSFQDLNINRFYKNLSNIRTSAFQQNSFIEKFNNFGNGKIGIDYYLSEMTTIGIALKGVFTGGENITDNKARVSDGQNNLQNRVNAYNTENSKFGNFTYSFLLRHKIDTTGSSIAIDADFVQYNTDNNQVFKNSIFNNGGIEEYNDTINGSLPTSIDILAIKLDYVKPFKNGLKFEAGIKTANTKTENEAIYANTFDGITSNNYDLSNKFLYDEWIHAAYLNFTKKVGIVDLQLGLRAENTSFKGNQLGNIVKPDSAFTKSYTNLFPTFYVLWVNDSVQTHSLSFSFGRRIDRPFFQDLNPFVSPLDKFTFYGGNPDLLPTYSYNFSLAHTFKNFFTSTLNYSKIVDGINETLEIKEGIYYSRPGNISNSTAITLSFEASKALSKRYIFTAYSELGRLLFKGKLYTEQLNSKGDYLFATVTNNFIFGKGWSAEIRGDYQSDVTSAQLLIKNWGTLNFGFQKKLFKEAGSLKLNFNDVLRTRRGDGIINNLQLTDADWNSVFDSRNVALAFTYKFGKITKQKLNSSGSQEEQNRVKS